MAEIEEIDDTGFQVVVSRRKKKVTTESHLRQSTRASGLDMQEVLSLIEDSRGITIKRIQAILNGYYVGEFTGNTLTMQQVGDLVYDHLLPQGLVRCTDEKPKKWYAVK
jgi:hypothetical protein